MNTLYQSTITELRERLLEIDDIQRAKDVLEWDQTTYMPNGGAPGRARQLSTLEKIRHVRSSDPELGKMLNNLQDVVDSLPTDGDDAALIRVVRMNLKQIFFMPLHVFGATGLRANVVLAENASSREQ